MKLLIDTNIMLDVLLKREPFCSDSVAILNLTKENIEIFVSASSITDIYYIANRELKNRNRVRDLLAKIVKVVRIAGVSESEILQALTLDWRDFEDCVQYSVARLQDMDGIVTRNPRDFRESDIKVWEPADLLREINASMTHEHT